MCLKYVNLVTGQDISHKLKVDIALAKGENRISHMICVNIFFYPAIVIHTETLTIVFNLEKQKKKKVCVTD
jgi:hypothetical protein